jgi:hypothetical protein
MNYIETPAESDKADYGPLAHIDKQSREHIFNLGAGLSASAIDKAREFVRKERRKVKLQKALTGAGGDVTAAAKALGYNYEYFRKLCRAASLEIRDGRCKPDVQAAVMRIGIITLVILWAIIPGNKAEMAACERNYSHTRCMELLR